MEINSMFWLIKWCVYATFFWWIIYVFYIGLLVNGSVAEVETSYPMTTDRPIEVLTNEDIEDQPYPNPTN